MYVLYVETCVGGGGDIGEFGGSGRFAVSIISHTDGISFTNGFRGGGSGICVFALRPKEGKSFYLLMHNYCANCCELSTITFHNLF